MNSSFLLLIDGSSLLSTQFFGNLPREILFAKTPEEKEQYFHKIMMTRKGVYTNAVFGFLRTLFRILHDQKPEYLAVCWDLTRDTFRRELYPEYKATRGETMAPLRDQFDLCQSVLREIGVRQFMDLRYEADDFCGSIAKRFETEIPVAVYTKDHDYLQLVTDRTSLWLMNTTQEKTDELYRKYRMDPAAYSVPERAFPLTPELVEKEFGVIPEHINSLKGLQGDSSDNIKGVPGIGPQTAVRLIAHYGTVDALYREIGQPDKAKENELKRFWKEELGITRSPLNFLLKTSETELVGEKAARLSEKLATIVTDIDLGDLELRDLRYIPEKQRIDKVLQELEFYSMDAGMLFDSETDKKKAASYRMINGRKEAEDLISSLLREKAAGVYYEKGAGLALSFREGEACLLRESDSIPPEILKTFLVRLRDAGLSLYSFEGKNIVKLSEVITEDLGIAAYLLDPTVSSYPYDRIAKVYLDRDVRPRAALIGKMTASEALDSDTDSALAFLSGAAETAFLASETLLEALREKNMLKLYREIELPTMAALAHLEETGILVKREELKAYGEGLKKEIDRIEQEIYTLSGCVFNINSPKQLGEVLFEKMKLPSGKKSKSGYSTAADILEKLAPDHEIVQKILDYRTLAKLRSTYAEGLLGFISPDGRIRGNFNQTVTATGRISSANPNLQNIPVRLELGREIRKVFVPEEGCVFIDADYSQIELRVLAHLSGDRNLIEAYRNARDIHALTASQVFHVPLNEVTPLMRRNAKAVNFGIVYGISAFALSEDLSISRKEAENYMRRYFETYPGVEKYLKEQVERAKKQGYVVTMFGRIRPIPELESANFSQRTFGERVAMNSPIQGTAADIMKIAVIRVEKRLKEEGLKSRIVLQVHDEILIEAPEAEADLAEALLTEEMGNAAELSVKLEVEAKRGYSWYETK